MEFIPVKMRRLNPPEDDLLMALDEALPELLEGDIVLVTSKVVAIDEGRCVPLTEKTKDELTREEADHYLLNQSGTASLPLTIKHQALLYRGGVDESNSGEYYTLLPEKPYESAARIREHLKNKNDLKQLGVIITDGMVLPLRTGVTGISLGVAGFLPARTHTAGEQDLFGKEVVETSTNLADSLAAGSVVVSGEAGESTPIVIARGVPNVTFTNKAMSGENQIGVQKDLYYPILRQFYS